MTNTDYAAATWRPSPNFGERQNCVTPWILLLHYTGMDTGEAAESWLCASESEVSSHYIVHEDGRVVQMVRERDRAWHAGASSWLGQTDINSASIGIEVVNGGHAFGSPPFPELQIAATVELCRDICARHRIAPRNVLAHSDVAPGRKIDPGERFPWHVLADAGVGLFPQIPTICSEPADVKEGSDTRAVADLQKVLCSYGYGVDVSGVYEARTRVVVAALQLHFRPGRVDGVADAETHAILAALTAAAAA